MPTMAMSSARSSRSLIMCRARARQKRLALPLGARPHAREPRRRGWAGQKRGQRGNGRVREHLRQRDLAAEALLHRRVYAEDAQRVAAEIEKVVRAADRVHTEGPPPDP